MKTSITIFVGDLKTLVAEAIEGSRTSLLTSFVDSSRVYTNLKFLILLPGNHEVTTFDGDTLADRLRKYCGEHELSIQASLEQLSIKYAVLTLRIQDNSTVEFSTITLKQHRRNIKKVSNSNKKVSETEKKKSSWLTKFTNFFRKL